MINSKDFTLNYHNFPDSVVAIRAYKQALAMNDKLVTPYFYLAELYDKLGTIDAAFLNYKKITEVSSNRSWSHSLFADFLYRSGNYTEAIEQYHQALRYPVFDASLIHTGLGLAYAKVDESVVPQKNVYALDQFDKALQNPGSNEAYIRSRYANVLVEFGYIDKAITQMELSLKVDPKISIETKLNLGQLYQSVGECEKAKELYEAVIKLADQIPIDYLEIVKKRLAILEREDGCEVFP